MKGNPRSLISLCVNYKRLGKYLLENDPGLSWIRTVKTTFARTFKSPIKTAWILSELPITWKVNQSIDFTLAISNDSICSPSQISLNAIIGSEASDLQSQAGFRGRWQAWYLGTNFSGRHSCGIQYLHNNLNWSKSLCQQCSNQLGRSSRILSWGTATRTSSREDWQFLTDVTW